MKDTELIREKMPGSMHSIDIPDASEQTMQQRSSLIGRFWINTNTEKRVRFQIFLKKLTMLSKNTPQTQVASQH